MEHQPENTEDLTAQAEAIEKRQLELNRRVAEVVRETRAYAVYKYPVDATEIHAENELLFTAEQRRLQYVWALVNPQSPLVPVDLKTSLPGLRRWNPELPAQGDCGSLEIYTETRRIADDFGLDLSEPHVILGGLVNALDNTVTLWIAGNKNWDTARYSMRLAGTGHPIGNFEAHFLKFACPVTTPDMSLVLHLFYAGET